MRVYLAAPLFSQMQRSWNRSLAEAIMAAMPEAEVILPQDIRICGRFNDAEHYPVLFRRCLEEIGCSDAMLAVLDDNDVDSGTAFEVGVAHTLGKPVIGVRTDYRPGPDHGVNIMLAQACRYFVREFAFQEEPAVLAEGVVRRLRALHAKPGPVNERL